MLDSADNQGWVGFLLAYSTGLFSPLVRPSLSLVPAFVATMRFSSAALAASLLALAGLGFAQFPSTPEGVTVLDSKFGDGVKLSWKEVCKSATRVSSTIH